MINQCKADWVDNLCNRPQGPLPALRESCNNWNECMTKTPQFYVKSSDVFIKLFVEDLNNFSDQVMLKSLGILFAIVCFISFMCACCKKIDRTEASDLIGRSKDDRY